jgi:hypothetical protein
VNEPRLKTDPPALLARTTLGEPALRSDLPLGSGIAGPSAASPISVESLKGKSL